MIPDTWRQTRLLPWVFGRCVACELGACQYRPVTRDGLSKREISWLLAQEARGAAQALRQGIEIQVRDSLSPPREIEAVDSGSQTSPLLDSFTALDDAMTLLGNLQSAKSSTRRGRIDVAALLYELAPGATITLEASAGTEVYGEELSLRRMLQLLLTDATGQVETRSQGPVVHVSRKNDTIQITADLGPDAAHQSELERRFLNRSAIRAGGHLEISGHALSLFLPAEGAAVQKELAALRSELSEAQEQGEAYARELAGVLVAAEQHVYSGHHVAEDSSFVGAQRLATSWRFHQALAAQQPHAQSSSTRELDRLLSLSQQLEEKRHLSTTWLEVERSIRSVIDAESAGGERIQFDRTDISGASFLPGASALLIEWLMREALMMTKSGDKEEGGVAEAEPEESSPIILRFREEAESLRVSAHYTEDESKLKTWTAIIGPGAETSRPVGAAWVLLTSFLKDTEHQAGSRYTDSHQVELWLRLHK